jgi:sialidase-1
MKLMHFLRGNREHRSALNVVFLSLFLLGVAFGGACNKKTPVKVDELAGIEKEINQAQVVSTNYCQTGSGGTDVHTKKPYFSDPIIFRGGTKEGGTEVYHSYRIPSIIKATSGTLIAFCEGRKNTGEDYGDIDVVYKRSFNNGATWSPLKVLFSKLAGTCGNPTAVVDTATNAIWILMSYNDENHSQRGDGGREPIDEWGERRVYVNVSYNDGETWDDLRNLTSPQVIPLSYTWDAVGPGNGIQIKHGVHTGRLIIPAIGRNIYSDDHGLTWQYMMINPGTSEGTIIERCNGDLIRNDRAAAEYLKERHRRQVSISSDNGATWSAWASNDQLLDPICQASIIRYNDSYPPRLIFINPANINARSPMKVRISYDEGLTWPRGRYLDLARGGYSSLTKTADFNIASLQEIGKDSKGRHSIIFRKFNLPWILDGNSEPVN